MSIIAALALAVSLPDSTKIVLSTSLEDQYFMCPVLTPRLVNRLKEECQCDVSTTEDLRIIIANTTNELDEERIKVLIDLVGFDPTHVMIHYGED